MFRMQVRQEGAVHGAPGLGSLPCSRRGLKRLQDRSTETTCGQLREVHGEKVKHFVWRVRPASEILQVPRKAEKWVCYHFYIGKGFHRGKGRERTTFQDGIRSFSWVWWQALVGFTIYDSVQKKLKFHSDYVWSNFADPRNLQDCLTFIRNKFIL